MPLPSKTVTLYLSPGACSLAPHILLHEIGVPFSTVTISRQGFPEDFNKLNPKMRVPVLVISDNGGEDDGSGQKEVITEVPAILTAIAQMTPDRKLLGRSDIDVVRSYEWMNWLSGTVHGQAFGGVWRPERFSDEREMWKGIVEKGRRSVENGLEMIECKLRESGGKWAVGREFGVVDGYLFVFWRWGVEVGIDMIGRFPWYGNLVKSVVERESTKKALKAEEIESRI